MHTRHACTVDPPVLLTSDVVGGSQQAEACNDELHGCRHGYKSLDFWNASFSGARRPIDDTMAPGKHTTHRLQNRIPKIPVYPLYGFYNSFCSLPSLSFSLSLFWGARCKRLLVRFQTVRSQRALGHAATVPQ